MLFKEFRANKGESQMLKMIGVLSLVFGVGLGCTQQLPRGEIRSLRTIGKPIPNSGEFTFDAENMVDGNLTTSWQTSTPHDSGVLVEFNNPVNLVKLRIANGFQFMNHPRFGNLLEKNSRVRGMALAMEVKDSDGSISTVTKEIELRDRTEAGYDDVALEQNNVLRIAFKPLSIYPGSKWADLAISEVIFFKK
jgi:hypothetical protein